MSAARPARAACRILAAALGLGVLALLPACAAPASFEVDPKFADLGPRRVAILPFVDRASGDQLLSRPFVALVDLLPVLSDDELTREHAPTILRLQLAANLHRSAHVILPLEVVDAKIAKHGIDVRAAYDRKDRDRVARELGEALDAELLLFGEVTSWDRSFYFLESRIEVGLRLEARYAPDGRRTFLGEVEESRSAGILELPVSTDAVGAGFSVFGNALKGLGSSGFAVLSHDVTRRMIDEGRAAIVRARYGEAFAAKPGPPSIAFAAFTPQGFVAPGDEVLVVASGDPHALATFRFGTCHCPTHMNEVAPGVYVGVKRVLPGEAFDRERLTVRLVSPLLQAATLTVQAPTLSSRPIAP